MLSLYSLVALASLLTFAIAFLLIYLRIERGGRAPTLRPLTGIASLRAVADQAIEEGQALHLALGSGSLSDLTAAETAMGLVVLDSIAEQANRTGQSAIVTTADPVSQLLAADQLRQQQAGRGENPLTGARFVAPQPAAYGAGTRGMMQRERLGVSVLVGHFGEEYLFLAEERPGGSLPIHQPELAATAQVETLPLVYLTAKRPVLGEEIFALGAYLTRWPSHLAGVVLQDLGRIIVIVAIVVGIVLRAAGAF
ncbi:MAG TPA: DUF6754 domain-containing protein [Ardenticatenaceae bacterium]|jgi:hypothetical protein